MFLIDNITSFIIVVTLSFMMTLRVHALCGQPKSLLHFLLGFLAIKETVAVATKVLEYNASKGSQVGGAVLSGIPMCVFAPSGAYPWINSLTNGMSLSFETALFSCTIYKFVGHIKESGLHSMPGMEGFFLILIKDHVLYYLLALLADVFTTLNIVPALQQSNSTGTIWDCVVIVQQAWIMAVMGPQLMIGLLKSEARLQTRDGFLENPLETMVFALGSEDIRRLTVEFSNVEAQD
ncbi:hypothetical protein CONPUDRAFT_133650 [Coniophora puteana RWD-64-598 SS2]|uniref:Uncharacterized protein n=1 Tax=Coniophora puteana (strain RWD-64-598) TaxID=741705 RepID=A0A5M3N403_CONPW|nr:uncharacterized protein CONPUDRAFT_133650 [Coniophora puteana RWD-64-598 SS2]EIW85977.1 hypothetical protein CONPUDRAFT_133650 [Coniophora puteana RWD-64-598 SS2]